MNKRSFSVSSYIAVLILLLSFCFDSFSAQGADVQKEIAYLKNFVETGVDYIKKYGTKRAYREFNRINGSFRKGELYIFVIGYDGVVRAHGDEPRKYVGKNLFNAKDKFGTPYFQLFVEAANRGGGIVSCYWPRPGADALQYKTSYIKAVDGQTFIGAGIYKALDTEAREAKVDRVKNYLAEAIEYFKKNGAEVAYKEFSNPKGKFAVEDLYVFVVGYDGYTRAHGGNPEKEVGANIRALTDEFGTPMLSLFIETAKSGGGLVGYYWPNYKKGGSIMFKTSYIEPLNDQVFIGAGYYGD